MHEYSFDSFCENALYAYYPNYILGYQSNQTDIMPSTFETFMKCQNYCKGDIIQCNAFSLKLMYQGSLCNDIPGHLRCYSCQSDTNGTCVTNP